MTRTASSRPLATAATLCSSCLRCTATILVSTSERVRSARSRGASSSRVMDAHGLRVRAGWGGSWDRSDERASSVSHADVDEEPLARSGCVSALHAGFDTAAERLHSVEELAGSDPHAWRVAVGPSSVLQDAESPESAPHAIISSERCVACSRVVNVPSYVKSCGVLMRFASTEAVPVQRLTTSDVRTGAFLSALDGGGSGACRV